MDERKSTVSSTPRIDKMISLMERQRTLTLKPLEWKSFVHHPQRNNLNNKSLEIRCMWNRALLVSNISVGTPQERLDEIPISVRLVPVDESYFKQQGAPVDDESVNGEPPVIGRINYFAPIRTADGVVNDEAGFVSAEIILGNYNYADVSRWLGMTPAPEFSIALTVLFDDEKRSWDGAKALAVTEVTLVFSGGPTINKEKMPPDSKTVFDELLLETRNTTKRFERSQRWVVIVTILMLVGIWFLR